MSDATEKAIRSIVIFRADWEPDQPGVAYGDVEYGGSRYSIQYSRPNHPNEIGETLSHGVAVNCNDGHDDNYAFADALGDDVDFEEVVRVIAAASGAEAAIESSLA